MAKRLWGQCPQRNQQFPNGEFVLRRNETMLKIKPVEVKYSHQFSRKKKLVLFIP